jgi:MscS family membrane protein
MLLIIDLYQEMLPGLPLNLFLRFFVIIIVAFILKGILAKALSKLLFFSFKSIASKPHTEKFNLLFNKPLQYLITCIGFFFGINQISNFLERIILFERHKFVHKSKLLNQESTTFSLLELADHILFFAFIYYAVLLITRVVSFVFYIWTENAFLANDKGKQQLLPLLRDVIIVIVWSFGFFTILGLVFHINVPTLIAGLGFGGVALAFASKESLENLLSSFMIMLDKPFSLGDHIKLGNIEGIVESLGFRSTRIRTFDKTLVSIPNKNLIGESLENFTLTGLIRKKLIVKVSYGTAQSNLKKAMEAIKEYLNAYPYINQESRVFLENMNDALEVHISYYIHIPTEKSMDMVKEEINLEIYKILYQYVGGFGLPTTVQLNKNEHCEVEY